MEPTAISLALGILVAVLSHACLGASWSFAVPFAAGTAIATWLAHPGNQGLNEPNERKLPRRCAIRPETRSDRSPSAADKARAVLPSQF